MKKQLTVYIDNILHKKIIDYSEKKRIRVDIIIEKALLNYLNKDTKDFIKEEQEITKDIKDPLNTKFKPVDKRVGRKRIRKPKEQVVAEKKNTVDEDIDFLLDIAEESNP